MKRSDLKRLLQSQENIPPELVGPPKAVEWLRKTGIIREDVPEPIRRRLLPQPTIPEAVRKGVIIPDDDEQPEAEQAATPVVAPVVASKPAEQESFDYPGDGPGERRTRRFLYRLMRKYPRGLPRRSKEDFRSHCCERHEISERAFDRIWGWAITETGATRYRTAGPRGPHSPDRYRR